MNLSDWEYKPITTLCDVERAVQGMHVVAG